MNRQELISRERVALAVLILLLLLAAAVGLELLWHGRAGAPPTQATPGQPGHPPAGRPAPPPAPALPADDGHGTSSPSGSGGTDRPVGESGSPAPPPAAGPPQEGESPSGGAPSPGIPGETQPPPSEEPTSMPFRVSGSVRGLVPGAAQVIVLTLTNPSSIPIRVTRVHVSVSADGTRAGCPSNANLVLEQAVGITTRDPVTVPAHGSVTLEAYPRAPRIAVRSLGANQNSCKGTTFGLTYTGSAHS